MRYLDTIKNVEINVWPWDKKLKKMIAKNPSRYLKMFEEE